MSTLTNLFISDTYTGLLHSNGAALPVTGQVSMSDGSGQVSALSLGIASSGAGASVTGLFNVSGLATVGDLKAGTLNYPNAPGGSGFFVRQNAALNALEFTNSIPSSFLGDLPGGTPGGTLYDNIDSIRVNDQGLVTEVNEFPNITGVTVTSTTYLNGPRTPTATFTVAGSVRSWVEVDLPSVYQGHKAGIFHILPQTMEWEGQFRCAVWASYNGAESGRYPIYSFDGDGDDEGNNGVQFCGRISSDGKIWFARDIVGSGINPLQYWLTCIAVQR